MSNDVELSIGELSRRTGFATSALRYYERLGVLRPDGRASGRRCYGPGSAMRIALIRLYQDVGFTLGEIRTILAAGSRRHPSWTRLMKGKLHELEATIAHATRAKTLIERGLACRHRELSMCPNFRAALNARLTEMARASARVQSPPRPSRDRQ